MDLLYLQQCELKTKTDGQHDGQRTNSSPTSQLSLSRVQKEESSDWTTVSPALLQAVPPSNTSDPTSDPRSDVLTPLCKLACS